MPKANWQSRYWAATLHVHPEIQPEVRGFEQMRQALNLFNSHIGELNFHAATADAEGLNTRRHNTGVVLGKVLESLLRIAMLTGNDLEDEGEIALSRLEINARAAMQAIPVREQRAPTLGELGGIYNE